MCVAQRRLSSPTQSEAISLISAPELHLTNISRDLACNFTFFFPSLKLVNKNFLHLLKDPPREFLLQIMWQETLQQLRSECLNIMLVAFEFLATRVEYCHTNLGFICRETKIAKFGVAFQRGKTTHVVQFLFLSVSIFSSHQLSCHRGNSRRL